LPNDEIRRAVSETLKEVAVEFGAPTVSDLGRAELIKQIFALEDAKSRHLDRGFIEPTLTVKDYAPRPEIPFRPDSVAAVH